MSFARSLAVVLPLEGGDVNDPDDPGGLTSRGVTQARYDEFCNTHGRPKATVTALTAAQIEDFYHLTAWAAVRGDALPWPASLVAFDAAVNQGEGYAPKMLQWAVGVTQDGVIGPGTMAAVKGWDAYWLADRMLWARVSRYVATCRSWEAKGKPRPWKFFAGWMARLASVQQGAGLNSHGQSAA